MAAQSGHNVHTGSVTSTQAGHRTTEHLPDRSNPPVPHRGHGRLSEVPHIAATILGVFAVTCFLWSLSPGFRFLTHVPRRYLDDYYIDAPETNLMWALIVGLLAGAVASRKRIAWWLLVGYMLLWISANAFDFAATGTLHALVALVVHVLVLGLLLAAWRIRPRPAPTA